VNTTNLRVLLGYALPYRAVLAVCVLLMLAESVAALCLTNPLVQTARVRIEKLDVFKDTTSVGVEIERTA